ERVREYARLSILALLLLGADRGGNFKAAKDNMLNLIEESLLAPERLNGRKLSELLGDEGIARVLLGGVKEDGSRPDNSVAGFYAGILFNPEL
ncbi:MAG: hypothetical protein RXS42_08575, partial [Nitrososphaeria archaeon]